MRTRVGNTSENEGKEAVLLSSENVTLIVP